METNDRSLIIDRCGRVPGIAADVAKINRNTVLPKHRVFSADASDRNTAIAGNADHLTEVIDCCGRDGAVARQWWKFMHSAVRLPHRSPELQDLERRIAGWIMDSIFCPPDYLTLVINAGGVAAVTSRERWQGCHLSVLPTETFADFPRRNTGGEKGPTRKIFAKRIGVCRFGDTHDHSIVALDRPRHSAVCPPERAQRDG